MSVYDLLGAHVRWHDGVRALEGIVRGVEDGGVLCIESLADGVLLRVDPVLRPVRIARPAGPGPREQVIQE